MCIFIIFGSAFPFLGLNFYYPVFFLSFYVRFLSFLNRRRSGLFLETTMCSMFPLTNVTFLDPFTCNLHISPFTSVNFTPIILLFRKWAKIRLVNIFVFIREPSSMLTLFVQLTKHFLQDLPSREPYFFQQSFPFMAGQSAAYLYLG